MNVSSPKTITPAADAWLHGDMHCHCERHDLIDRLVDGVADRLDFMALTNHAQKPVLREQGQMIRRARDRLPNVTVFCGLEWNAPLGRHLNVVLPPSDDEAELAVEFAQRFDREVGGTRNDVYEAMAFLSALPVSHRPIAFFNHPRNADHWHEGSIDTYLDADTGGVLVGLEAMHGHQPRAPVDPDTYPGCCVGGLADHFYRRRGRCAMLAHSDLHIHKRTDPPDYALGVGNRTMVKRSINGRDPGAIFDAIRAGHTCCSMGRWIELRMMAVNHHDGSRRISIVLEADQPVGCLDLIGVMGRHDSPTVVHAFGEQPAGRVAVQWSLPLRAEGFIRLRAVAQRPIVFSDERPTKPRLFFSSPITLTQ